MSDLPSVAVLGAGTMGRAIAKQLATRGIRVTVYSRSARTLEDFAENIWGVFETPAAAVAEADVILSCVSNDCASRAVWFGPHGAANSLKCGAQCLELSTLTTAWTLEWVSTLAAKGGVPIDCPVTGSKRGAEEGSLVAFVGALRGEHQNAEAIIDCIARKRIHFDTPGTAMQFKLAYNTIGAGICTVFAEGLAIMEAVGLDMEVALEALSEGGWSSPISKSKGNAMANHTYSDVSFRSELMLKDLEYAEKSFSSLGLPRPLAAAVVQKFRETCQLGFADEDFSAVLETYSGSKSTA